MSEFDSSTGSTKKNWVLREHDDEDPKKWNPAVISYNSKEPWFSILIHHSGKFRVKDGKFYYVNASLDIIDYVDVMDLSLRKLRSLGEKLGFGGDIQFYFSPGNPYSPQEVNHLKTDWDMMDFNLWAGPEKVVGVWVDHEGHDPDEIVGEWVPHNDETVNQRDDGDEAFVRIGVTVDSHEVEEVRHVSDFVELRSNGEEDCDMSIGSDSTHSDYYYDSDDHYDLDGDKYEDYVDKEAEWFGVKDYNCRKENKVEKHKSDQDSNKCEFDDEIIEVQSQEYNGGKVFNPKVDMKVVRLEVGLTFKSADECRNAIKQHAIRLGKNISFPFNNNRMKIQAKCCHEGCPWYVFASRTPQDATWRIKTLGPKHGKCPRLNKVAHCTSTWLANKYKRLIKLIPDWKVEDMIEYFREKERLLFTNWQMYRLKHLVLGKDNNMDAYQYKMIYRYAEEIFRSNPGSTVKVQCKLTSQNQARFERIYICWHALKMGMLDGCRRVIFLDGCHIKTKYGGVILTAVGLDPNNGLYPFAYAVVEKETQDSWTWFLKLVVEDLGISPEHTYTWTIVSDKQKGLLAAVDTTFPDAEHRYCVYHLYENFKLQFKGLTFKELLWRAAKATRPVDYERVMEELQKTDEAAHQWLASKDPAHWSKAYFRTMNNTDVILNNISESFNALLVRPRKLPLLQMLEVIRLLLMKRIGVRVSEMLQHNGIICPRIADILNETEYWSVKYNSMWNGKDSFQVDGGRVDTWVVNVKEKTCSCRRWQLTGIPCGHAISCLPHMGVQPEEVVDHCYRKETFMRVYSHCMEPMVGPDEWPNPPIDKAELVPPIISKMPGRPKKYRRRRKAGEKGGERNVPRVVGNKLSKHGVQMSCSECHEWDHNKAGCPLKKFAEKSKEVEPKIKKSQAKVPISKIPTEVGPSKRGPSKKCPEKWVPSKKVEKAKKDGPKTNYKRPRKDFVDPECAGKTFEAVYRYENEEDVGIPDDFWAPVISTTVQAKPFSIKEPCQETVIQHPLVTGKGKEKIVEGLLNSKKVKHTPFAPPAQISIGTSYSKVPIDKTETGAKFPKQPSYLPKSKTSPKKDVFLTVSHPPVLGCEGGTTRVFGTRTGRAEQFRTHAYQEYLKSVKKRRLEKKQ